MCAARRKNSRRWMAEHLGDAHVKRARAEGYRSRAVYKLMELDARDRLLEPGLTVLELGAAPGGWTQYLSEKLGDKGCIVASDILPMDALADVSFIQGDFTEQSTADAIHAAMPGRADLVLSDMAPNISGVAASDQARAMALVELATEAALEYLKPDGMFVVKVFQGEGFDDWMRGLRQTFVTVKVRKPDASRARSREVYVVAARPRNAGE